MTKMDKLIGTLPEEDVRKVKKWAEDNPEEVPKNVDEAVETLIYNILWDYRSRAEAAPVKEAMEINKKKAELYKKWEKLGIVTE